MAYTVERLLDSTVREEVTNGTGTGTLYVKHRFSKDGVVDIVDIVCEGAPSTTDTYGICSTWRDITNAKMYLKTGATTWTVIGSVT